MSKGIFLLRKLAMPALLGLSLSACALGRDVVDISAPVSTATDSKAFVKIIDVKDDRHFEASPRDAGTPSLKDAADINDRNITAHAVARKRNGYGMALGDIVLPDSKTVASLAREAAQKALQDKGYALVNETSPHYADAKPLNIDITEFWAWIAPGFTSMTMEFKSTVTLTGDAIVGSGNNAASTHLTKGAIAAFESTWIDTIQRGVADLSDQIATKIKPAGAIAQQPSEMPDLSPGM
jgi:hypothetical protein